MPNLKEVRNRIQSVKSTMQITSAMKMVSAAKLKRAQDAIVGLRPYATKLSEIMGNLSGSLSEVSGGYAEKREVKNVLIVAINSNRGLCGAFNSSIIKEVNRLIREDYEGKNVHVLGLGKKAHEAYNKTGHKINDGSLSGEHFGIFDNLDYEHVSEIAELVMKSFEEKQYDEIKVVYNRFKNAATQFVTTEQFLPVVMEETEEDSNANLDYIFEPEKEEILVHLLPKSLKTQLYKAL